MEPTRSELDDRAEYSRTRLEELATRLASVVELDQIPNLTVFAAGSFARLEASQYSDLDLFFITEERAESIAEPHTKSLRIFGQIIDIADSLNFPKFSNDGEYLEILHASDILTSLGGRIDDQRNFFTARMLLLLESYCLYGREAHDRIAAQIVDSYFKDFPDHPDTFQPLFLINDICRYWKTLLLNYENKRNLPPGVDDEEARRTRQKVRNFKLKYSRMTTCFASVAALGSYPPPVTQQQVLAIVQLTPRGRLERLAAEFPGVTEQVRTVLDAYTEFLQMTAMPTGELEGLFGNPEQRSELFARANRYGDSMFELLRAIEVQRPTQKLLRYLVI